MQRASFLRNSNAEAPPPPHHMERPQDWPIWLAMSSQPIKPYSEGCLCVSVDSATRYKVASETGQTIPVSLQFLDHIQKNLKEETPILFRHTVTGTDEIIGLFIPSRLDRMFRRSEFTRVAEFGPFIFAEHPSIKVPLPDASVGYVSINASTTVAIINIMVEAKRQAIQRQGDDVLRRIFGENWAQQRKKVCIETPSVMETASTSSRVVGEGPSVRGPVWTYPMQKSWGVDQIRQCFRGRRIFLVGGDIEVALYMDIVTALQETTVLEFPVRPPGVFKGDLYALLTLEDHQDWARKSFERKPCIRRWRGTDDTEVCLLFCSNPLARQVVDSTIKPILKTVKFDYLVLGSGFVFPVDQSAPSIHPVTATSTSIVNTVLSTGPVPTYQDYGGEAHITHFCTQLDKFLEYLSSPESPFNGTFMSISPPPYAPRAPEGREGVNRAYSAMNLNLVTGAAGCMLATKKWNHKSLCLYAFGIENVHRRAVDGVTWDGQFVRWVSGKVCRELSGNELLTGSREPLRPNTQAPTTQVMRTTPVAAAIPIPIPVQVPPPEEPPQVNNNADDMGQESDGDDNSGDDTQEEGDDPPPNQNPNPQVSIASAAVQFPGNPIDILGVIGMQFDVQAPNGQLENVRVDRIDQSGFYVLKKTNHATCQISMGTLLTLITLWLKRDNNNGDRGRQLSNTHDMLYNAILARQHLNNHEREMDARDNLNLGVANAAPVLNWVDVVPAPNPPSVIASAQNNIPAAARRVGARRDADEEIEFNKSLEVREMHGLLPCGEKISDAETSEEEMQEETSPRQSGASSKDRPNTQRNAQEDSGGSSQPQRPNMMRSIANIGGRIMRSIGGYPNANPNPNPRIENNDGGGSSTDAGRSEHMASISRKRPLALTAEDDTPPTITPVSSLQKNNMGGSSIEPMASSSPGKRRERSKSRSISPMTGGKKSVNSGGGGSSMSGGVEREHSTENAKKKHKPAQAAKKTIPITVQEFTSSIKPNVMRKSGTSVKNVGASLGKAALDGKGKSKSAGSGGSASGSNKKARIEPPSDNEEVFEEEVEIVRGTPRFCPSNGVLNGLDCLYVGRPIEFARLQQNKYTWYYCTVARISPDEADFAIDLLYLTHKGTVEQEVDVKHYYGCFAQPGEYLREWDTKFPKLLEQHNLTMCEPADPNAE